METFQTPESVLQVGYVSFLTKFGREIEKILSEDLTFSENNNNNTKDVMELKREMIEQNDEFLKWMKENEVWKNVKRKEDTIIGGLDRRNVGLDGGIREVGGDKDGSEEESEESEDDEEEDEESEDEDEDDEKRGGGKGGIVWNVS